METLVWLTHAEAAASQDSYGEILRTHGFEVVAAPLIAVRAMPREVIIGALLSCAPRALVATSPRAFSQLHAAISDEPQLLKRLQTLPCYTLSGRSAEAAVQYGWKVCGPQAWNAKELASVLCAMHIEGPLLFPCSKVHSGHITRTLSEHGVSVIEVPLYETTKPAPAQLEKLEQLWYERRPGIVCFFSPSAVATALTDLPFLQWKDVERVAIGQTTADALAERGLAAHAVASAPTPHALLETIETMGQ